MVEQERGLEKNEKKGAVSNIEGLHKIGGKEPSVNYVKTTRFMVPQEFIYIYIYVHSDSLVPLQVPKVNQTNVPLEKKARDV